MNDLIANEHMHNYAHLASFMLHRAICIAQSRIVYVTYTLLGERTLSINGHVHLNECAQAIADKQDEISVLVYILQI